MQAQGPESQRSLKKLKRKNWKQILLVSGLTRQETKRKMKQKEMIKHKMEKIQKL